MAGLLDFLQSASNAAASNVSGPVDMLGWALRKAGVPVGQQPVLGSEWMKQKGLMRDVPQSAASLAGETAGLLSPIGIAAKAPQIAAWRNAVNELAESGAGRMPFASQRGAVVWHGSPHKFDKFDASKIGTGEGAQAYGHGLYLADAIDTGKSYATALARPTTAATVRGVRQTFDSGAMRGAEQFAASMLNTTKGDVLKAIELTAAHKQPNGLYAAQPELADEIVRLLRTKQLGDVSEDAGKYLYKVDLPDEQIAKMLDWDKPLSQQAPEVQKVIKTYKGANWWTVNKDRVTGAKLTREIQGKAPTEFSSALADMGVPGIRYLDGGSRSAGQGTSNYVVFPGNEGLLSILERNGVPIKGLLGE
jgi:hypothetical protein